MSYFFVFFNEIKLRKIPLIFDVEKRLWKSELCFFQPSIQKWWKGQKYFYGRFHTLWSCLFTTKLSCLQKKKDFGHTIAVLNISIFSLGLLPNQCWRWGRMSPFWIFCPFFLSPWCTVYYYDSKISGPCVYFAELDYGLFRQSNIST